MSGVKGKSKKGSEINPEGGLEWDGSCPEARNYAECPRWVGKTCDAINCWGQYPTRDYPRRKTLRAER